MGVRPFARRCPATVGAALGQEDPVMRKVWWIAFATAALTVADQPARAEEPAGNAPCATCGSGGQCGACNPCGGSHLGHKCKRFFDWLIYVPLDHGKTKCCKPCDSCRPPVWVFFPCESSGCRNCAHGHGAGSPETVYYTKAAGTNASGVVQSGYTPQAGAATNAAGKPLSTYKPASVAGNMPVLEPSQFRKPPAAGSCAAGNR
jgi:hypothetical protein